jgi:hypothetical protein
MAVRTEFLNVVQVSFGFKGLNTHDEQYFNQYLTVCFSEAPYGAAGIDRLRSEGSVAGLTVEVTLRDHQWAVNRPPHPPAHSMLRHHMCTFCASAMCDIWTVLTSGTGTARTTSGHVMELDLDPLCHSIGVCIFKIITS